MEKEQLVAVVNKDKEMMEIFTKQYGGLLFKVSQKYMPLIDDFMFNEYDLLHDLIIYIMDSNIIQNFQGKAKFETYLYAVCRNYFLKKIRGAKRLNELIFTSADLSNLCVSIFKDNDTRSPELKKALIEGIEQMDFKSRLFIRMFFYDKRPPSEIMLLFNFSSINSVYSLKHRILNKLKDYFREKGYFNG